MSLEKEVTLRALGAEIVRTPTEAPSESDESNIGVARRLQKLIPGGIVLDQYNNPNNPLAHEFATGEEIVAQVAQAGTGTGTRERKSTGKVDVFIAGVGTGGTISGCSKAIKKHNSDAIIVGVDPVSIHSLFFPPAPSATTGLWSRREYFRMTHEPSGTKSLSAPLRFEFRKAVYWLAQRAKTFSRPASPQVML